MGVGVQQSISKLSLAMSVRGLSVHKAASIPFVVDHTMGVSTRNGWSATAPGMSITCVPG